MSLRILFVGFVLLVFWVELCLDVFCLPTTVGCIGYGLGFWNRFALMFCFVAYCVVTYVGLVVLHLFIVLFCVFYLCFAAVCFVGLFAFVVTVWFVINA